jgi:hypothetical protein
VLPARSAGVPAADGDGADGSGPSEARLDPNGVRIARPISSTVGVLQDEALLDVELIAPLDTNGRLPANVDVGWGGVFFPAGALEDIPPFVGSAFPEVDAAAIEFFATVKGGSWPQGGWRVLHATDQRVLLVQAATVAGDNGVAIMTFERDIGPWRFAGGQLEGPCDLLTSPGSGLNLADWELDPNAIISPDSTVLFTLVTEGACASGDPLGEFLVGPDVVITEAQVLIAYASRPRPGAQTCPGNPTSSVVIVLSSPLGNRTIADGLQVGGTLADYLG